MAINSNIALQARGIELQDPLNQLTKISNLQSAQNQNELNQMQMGEARRGMQEKEAVRNYFAQNPDTTNPAFSQGLYGVSPTQGMAFEKFRSEQGKAKSDSNKASSDLLTARLDQSKRILGQINPNSPSAGAAYMAWHRAQHSDSVIGPALTQFGVKESDANASIEAAIAQGPQALANMINQSVMGVEKFMTMNKPVTTQIDQGGRKLLVQTPGMGGTPTTVGTFDRVPLPDNVAAQEARLKAAGRTTVNVNTAVEGAYSKAFAGKLADTDITKLETAERAPRLAESANRIVDLLNTGNIITGTAADIKLAIARGMNMTGANNAELISNTERLISSQGQATLDAIKGAGLGTGQGFTDKDLKFLQGIAGGTINLTAETIRELATIQHSVAQRSATAWNTRAKQIPNSAVAGTGLSIEPVTIPAFKGAAAGNSGWTDAKQKRLEELDAKRRR